MEQLLRWPIIGSGLAVLLLVILFTLVVTVRRAEMRSALGLPKDAELGEAEEQMFQAFKDTDVRLSKSMPKFSKFKRHEMARETLRKDAALQSSS
jgi:hypothetical protein